MRERRPPAAPPRPRRSRRRRKAGLLRWGLGAALVALAVGYWIAARRPRAPEAPPAAGPPIAGTIEEIYRRGRTLLDGKHAAEALPYLRHAVRGRPDLPQTHQSYAVALLNTAHDVRVHRGLPGPATRSSLDRSAIAGEALAELATAERLGQTPRDRARALRLRAQVMGAWGFRWDAFVLYRQAQAGDPSWQEPGFLGDQMMMMMRDPTRPQAWEGGADAEETGP